MIGEQKEREKVVGVTTKISPEAAEILNSIAKAKGIEVYELLQLMCYVLVRSTSDKHNMSDEINRILTLFHSEVGWKDVYNSCNPTAEKEVSQEILILEQKGKKGFGAVMVSKPYFGEWIQTECADDIVGRVIEVCMPGVYRRLRHIRELTGCESITDLLITITDASEILELEEADRREMQAANNIAENGREYQYGRKAKSYHHRTPDGEAARQQRIVFDDIDHDAVAPELQECEGEHSDKSEEPKIRPHGYEW